MSDVLDKLPKWARDRIERAERQAADWKRRCNVLEGGLPWNKKGMFVRLNAIDPGRSIPSPLPLEDRAEILFGPRDVEIGVRWDFDGECLLLHGTGRNSGRLALYPNVANSVSVRVVE